MNDDRVKHADFADRSSHSASREPIDAARV